MLSHPAEDIGTMGFLFMVHRDWSAEGFLTDPAAEGGT